MYILQNELQKIIDPENELLVNYPTLRFKQILKTQFQTVFISSFLKSIGKYFLLHIIHWDNMNLELLSNPFCGHVGSIYKLNSKQCINKEDILDLFFYKNEFLLVTHRTYFNVGVKKRGAVDFTKYLANRMYREEVIGCEMPVLRIKSITCKDGSFQYPHDFYILEDNLPKLVANIELDNRIKDVHLLYYPRNQEYYYTGYTLRRNKSGDIRKFIKYETI